MISNLRFTFMAFIMLVLLGFGFQNQANGQVGLDGLFCPAVPNETGWLETIITSSGADFTGSVIGTVEDSGVDAVAGLDWQHVDATGYANNPTNEPGTQLVTWWTQKEDRNTYVQVTNNSDVPVSVHVRIHNESCAEIRDFCDTYTPFDTHEYNLGDLFANGGANIPDGNLQGSEGWLVVTAVKDCGGAQELPLDYNYLTGQLIVHDADDYLYGANTYARRAICEDECVEVQRVKNNSFQNGDDDWYEEQSYFTLALSENFSGEVITTPANKPNSPNMGFVIANAEDDDDGGSFGSGECYLGGSFENDDDDDGSGCVNIEDDDDDYNGDTCLKPAPRNCNLVNFDDDDDEYDGNVALMESAPFEVANEEACQYDDPYLTYNLRMFMPATFNIDKPIGGLFLPYCQNYTSVMLIKETPNLPDDECAVGQKCGTIVDARCYQEGNNINFARGEVYYDRQPEDDDDGMSSRECQLLSDSDADIAFDQFEFDGASGWLIGEMLQTAGAGDYYIHVVAAQTDVDGEDCIGTFGEGLAVFETGALVNNFQLNEEIELLCDDCLDGSPNAKLANVNPGTLFGQFDLLPGNTLAGADVVHINFADDYGAGVGEIGEGPYRPVAAFSNVSVSIFDEFEQDVSCGDASVCFVRLGIDDALVQSDNFQPATPTPTPTVAPTSAPPTLIPTPTPTPTGGGGSSSCAIAGSPVQLGTALANVLIPLVPVAFAFGVRAVRRRKK